MLRSVFIILLFGVAFSCARMPVVDRDKLYSQQFLGQISTIKSSYRMGRHSEALNRLGAMPDGLLTIVERAYRDNLMGVVLFSMGNYGQSINYFKRALPASYSDVLLTSQIYMNAGGAYYKLGHAKEADEELSNVRFDILEAQDKKKFHMLRYNVAKELGRDKVVVKSLVGLLDNITSLLELRSNPMFTTLASYYFRVNERERINILLKGPSSPSLVAGYLSYLDAEGRYYSGKRDEASYIIRSIAHRYSSNAEISEIISSFFSRIENSSNVNNGKIGLVLPMSGKRAVFGRRALLGFDKAVRDFALDKYDIHIVDSKGSGIVGRSKIKELVESHNVAAIIGGLFSDEATEEYLEARNHGVFFISLSQVYLSKAHKSHLLLEVPGSIESQIDRLLSDDVLKNLGTRGAIVYPEDSRGETYIDEFWRKAKIKSIDVTGVQSYGKNKTDYRDPIKGLLGLKFIRERQEEFDMLSEIYRLKRRSSIRRIQVLKPQIDFDWVFIPALPREALQIIPSFAYFDAFNVNLIGVPSWRSSALARRRDTFANSYFIGDDISNLDETFVSNFMYMYNSKPRMIEILGYDSFKLLSAILDGSNTSTRDELDRHIRSKGKLSGLSGTWSLRDGIWLKSMHPHRFSRGKIEKLYSFR